MIDLKHVFNDSNVSLQTYNERTYFALDEVQLCIFANSSR